MSTQTPTQLFLRRFLIDIPLPFFIAGIVGWVILAPITLTILFYLMQMVYWVILPYKVATIVAAVMTFAGAIAAVAGTVFACAYRAEDGKL